MPKTRKKNKKGAAKKSARKKAVRQPKLNKGIKSFSDKKLSESAKYFLGS